MARTDATIRQVFAIYLPYEVGRLVEMYDLLLKPDQYREKLAPKIAETTARRSRGNVRRRNFIS